MLRFNAWQIASLLRQMNEAKEHAVRACVQGFGDKPIDENLVKTDVESIVQLARSVAQAAMLESTLDRVQENHGYFCIEISKRITFQEYLSQLRVLRETIEADLKRRNFVFILPEKARLLDEMENKWNLVWTAIPKCKTDVEEAVYCYALGRSTATVFHCMCVAEYGLRTLAKRVRVKLTDKRKPQIIEYAT